jgi:hypothetical protein
MDTALPMAIFTGRPSVYSFANDSTEVNASAILERSKLTVNKEAQECWDSEMEGRVSIASQAHVDRH